MTRDLRVLVLIDSLTWGGAEMLLADLVESGNRAGMAFEVAYLAHVNGSPAATRLVKVGLQPEDLHGTRLYDARGLARVVHHVRRVRPDVVHTHLDYADLLGGLAGWALRIPTFSTLHVMEWDCSGRERIKSEMMAFARRRAARVVAVSSAGRDAYLSTGWDRPDHVVTVPNGIRDRRRAGAGARVRRELGLAADDIVVTMVTVLRHGKGHDVAAAAVAELRARYGGVRLVVLGEGDYRAEIERMIAPLGDAALLTGQRDDVADVLDATDVLLHPTRIDALPTALIEAMAASVPSVATAVGGIPELVIDGVTGVLVAPPPTPLALVAALEPLVADPLVRHGMGAAGRARYEREFTADTWVRRLRALYEEGIDNTPRGAVRRRARRSK